MRITRKNYERARKVVDQAREQMKFVKIWEEAAAELGTLDNQRLIAITVNDDGTIRTECELVQSRGDRQAAQSKPQ